MIFGSNADSGQGVAVDALGMLVGGSEVNSPLVIGLDGRRRISLLASGLSSGVTNFDRSNDIWLANGQLLENLAEAVSVEARTTDGRVFNLPVEYAGWQGQLPGIDQVNVVLLPELRGAGVVQFTIIAMGIRSNTLSITIN